jgi:TctA family transporter
MAFPILPEYLFSPDIYLYLLLGILWFYVFGILPIVGALQALILLIPLVYRLDPPQVFALLLGGKAGMWLAESTASILLGIPGGSATVPLIMDGFQLTRKGRYGLALGATAAASIAGGVIFSFICIFLISIVLRVLQFLGPSEILLIILWGLITSVIVLSEKNRVKSLFSAILGLLLSTVGFSYASQVPRFLFGTYELWEGIPMIPLFMGVLVMPEFIKYLVRREKYIVKEEYLHLTTRNFFKDFLIGFRETFRSIKVLLQSIIIGGIIGIIPGVGLATASFLGYSQASLITKRKEKPGEGNLDGVIGPQAAIAACYPGALFPTVAFAVPGSSSEAIILGLLIIKGLMPGPSMLAHQTSLVYYMFWIIIIGTVIGTLFSSLLLPPIVKILKIQITTWAPILIALVFISTYIDRFSFLDLILLLIFTILGYVMQEYGYSTALLVIGYVLGDLVEVQTALVYQLYGLTFLLSPSTLVLLSILTLVTALSMRAMRSKRSGES